MKITEISKYHAIWSIENNIGYIVLYGVDNVLLNSSSYHNLEEFKVVVDLLRNEKPLYFNDINKQIGTGDMVDNEIYAKNILREGESLKKGEYLQSANGYYRLCLQEDGNLVVYDIRNGSTRWASNTAGKAVSHAIMQNDGNFVVYGYPQAVWNTGTMNWSGAFLVLEDDGDLIIRIGNVNLWINGKKLRRCMEPTPLRSTPLSI